MLVELFSVNYLSDSFLFPPLFMNCQRTHYDFHPFIPNSQWLIFSPEVPCQLCAASPQLIIQCVKFALPDV